MQCPVIAYTHFLHIQAKPLSASEHLEFDHSCSSLRRTLCRFYLSFVWPQDSFVHCLSYTYGYNTIHTQTIWCLLWTYQPEFKLELILIRFHNKLYPLPGSELRLSDPYQWASCLPYQQFFNIYSLSNYSLTQVNKSKVEK